MNAQKTIASQLSYKLNWLYVQNKSKILKVISSLLLINSLGGVEIQASAIHESATTRMNAEYKAYSDKLKKEYAENEIRIKAERKLLIAKFTKIEDTANSKNSVAQQEEEHKIQSAKIRKEYAENEAKIKAEHRILIAQYAHINTKTIIAKNIEGKEQPISNTSDIRNMVVKLPAEIDYSNGCYKVKHDNKVRGFSNVVDAKEYYDRVSNKKESDFEIFATLNNTKPETQVVNNTQKVQNSKEVTLVNYKPVSTEKKSQALHNSQEELASYIAKLKAETSETPKVVYRTHKNNNLDTTKTPVATIAAMKTKVKPTNTLTNEEKRMEASIVYFDKTDQKENWINKINPIKGILKIPHLLHLTKNTQKSSMDKTIEKNKTEKTTKELKSKDSNKKPADKELTKKEQSNKPIKLLKSIRKHIKQ
jgi:hypothetical protein